MASLLLQVEIHQACIWAESFQVPFLCVTCKCKCYNVDTLFWIIPWESLSVKEGSLQTFICLSFINIYISSMLSVHQSGQKNSPFSFSELFPTFNRKVNTPCWNVKPAKVSCMKKMVVFRTLLVVHADERAYCSAHTEEWNSSVRT